MKQSCKRKALFVSLLCNYSDNELQTVKLRNITHQSLVAGAFYGTLGKELAVLLFREQFPWL